MIKDKDTCQKIIEAILFANSDLVDEKDLKSKLPKGVNIKNILYNKNIKIVLEFFIVFFIVFF